MDLKKIRLEYYQKELNLEDLDPSPTKQFQKWFQEALKAEISYPNAATLATLGQDGFPQARVILIKEITDQGIIFFTNYESSKACEINQHNKVGLNLFWKELDRQIRICGRVSKISSIDSEIYFRSRPRESQISAIVSPQSKVVKMSELVKSIEKMNHQYPNNSELPMPNWGGFIISPFSFEFWQGRPNRLHDRFKYTQNSLNWKIDRLAP